MFGEGGASGGEAGHAGAGGEGGTSGETGPVGGEAGAIGAGDGGSSGRNGCDAIVIAGFEPNNPDWPAVNGQIASFSPAGGGSDPIGELAVDFRLTTGGDQSGTFTLGAGDQANFATCSHCVLAYDANARYFFATSGTLSLDSNSDQVHGYPHGDLVGVTLREVSLVGDDWTLVPNGDCLFIASATVDVVPSEGWSECPSDFRGDGLCHCGCGAFDSADCADQTVDACYSCWCTDDSGDCSDTSVVPADNGQCG
jgi:hypothetical protein